ncbi:hypothetical protein KSS87_007058 [Heliosperma pusillum]|nr:hypothetical protein KSS87_022952 [Heliosperma pusillum]KAH9617415.1 hypothetical protein KSS87_007058 [Heliosperma pusillum]
MGKRRGPSDEDFNNCPPWLKPLLRGKFFVQCKNHPDYHKNECNMYCLTCVNDALCSLCLENHPNHSSIQIRRSSYNDVVRMSDIPKELDIRGIQTYIINGAKVVFLNERPQSRPGKGVTHTCQVCERSLVDDCLFCSLGCKIVGTSKNFEKKNKRKSFGSESEDSCTTSSTTTREEVMNNNNVVQSFTPTPTQTSLNNFRSTKRRRKGIPYRAPLS